MDFRPTLSTIQTNKDLIKQTNKLQLEQYKHLNKQTSHKQTIQQTNEQTSRIN